MNTLGTIAAVLSLSIAWLPERAPAPVTHATCAPALSVSDPDPVDCPFCAGNPAVHLKAVWALQKATVRAFHARLL